MDWPSTDMIHRLEAEISANANSTCLNSTLDFYVFEIKNIFLMIPDKQYILPLMQTGLWRVQCHLFMDKESIFHYLYSFLSQVLCFFFAVHFLHSIVRHSENVIDSRIHVLLKALQRSMIYRYMGIFL